MLYFDYLNCITAVLLYICAMTLSMSFELKLIADILILG